MIYELLTLGSFGSSLSGPDVGRKRYIYICVYIYIYIYVYLYIYVYIYIYIHIYIFDVTYAKRPFLRTSPNVFCCCVEKVARNTPWVDANSNSINLIQHSKV